MSGTIISLDLGGTRIRTARLDRDLEIIERYETLTLADEGYEPTLERIKEAIRKVLPTDGTPVLGIGVSVPGPLNPETGVLVAPPNLKGWHNVPIGDILHETFNVPVYAGNDANVAALAEAARGAARGYRYAIYITISTGVGSGIINDGRLLLGKQGLGAEAGHIQLIVADGVVSSVEKEAAGPSMARQVRALVAEGHPTSLTELVDDLEDIDAKVLGRAANAGDELAIKVVEYGAFCMGLGIVTLLHLFNPEIVVIGGGVSQIGDLIFDKIEATVKKHALDEAYWKNLRIVPAALGGDVSIVGAAALVVTQGGQEDITQVIAAINDND